MVPSPVIVSAGSIVGLGVSPKTKAARMAAM